IIPHGGIGGSNPPPATILKAAPHRGRLSFMSRVSDKPYFVYVLWSDSGGRFYTGIADDPEHRLEQHNSPAGKHWTMRFRPWRLVFREIHPDFTAARKRENELKKQKGGTGFFEKTGLDPTEF